MTAGSFRLGDMCFFFLQLHVLLLSMVAAAAAVAVLSICVDAVRTCYGYRLISATLHNRQPIH